MMGRAWWFVPMLAAACASRATGGGAGSPAGPPERADVQVGPEALAQGKDALGAWIVYGARKAKLFEARSGRVHNRSTDDFALELGARAALAEVWREQRVQADKPNPYLDLLVDLQQAGFLDEYVVAFLAKPGWTVPGDALAAFDLGGFTSWRASRLAGHQPVTLVAVEPQSGRRWPDNPGAGLPSANELVPKKVPCASSVPRMSEALAGWAREEASLDGAPLAAATREEFARLLDWARAQPEYQRRGVTWVSPSPADLQFLVGFCAVERQDLAEASRALGESVRLNPLAPGTRLELSHVLVLQKKFDEADRQIDGVLATTQERCELARAWRRRGYILVERGRLEEAYTAYQKSLDHDPSNRIALDEMVFIVRELQRLGGSGARAFKPYQPPTGAPRQVVTECPAE
jgi:tetratricopeptide (TPR) repeat protein